MKILDYIQRFLHDSISQLNDYTDEKGIDLEKEKHDPRDYQYEEHFSGEIFGAAIPDEFIRTLDDLPPLLYQNGILSCVSCTCTFINMYGSKTYDENDVILAWRYIYSNVVHFPTGTNVRENLSVLKSKGQCLDLFLPQSEYYKGERVMQDKSLITHEADCNAETYKIEAYYFIRTYVEAEMKTAIMNAPIGVGVYITQDWFNVPSTKPIKYNGYKGAGHLISFVGWTRDAWIVADWDIKDPAKRRLKLLDKKYPLELAFTIRDRSDKLLGKLMKPFKLEGTDRLGVILPSGKYQWIATIAQWNALNDKKLLVGETKLITQSELNSMVLDQSPVAVLQ